MILGKSMRTTLDLDEDVLAAAKELARRERKTAGRLISELLRQALVSPHGACQLREAQPAYGTGFEPFPSRGGLATNEMVDRLRDEEGV